METDSSYLNEMLTLLAEPESLLREEAFFILWQNYTAGEKFLWLLTLEQYIEDLLREESSVEHWRNCFEVEHWRNCFEMAEWAGMEQPSLLCLQSALLYYQYLASENEHILFLAQENLAAIEKEQEHFFKERLCWYLLWAKILLALGSCENKNFWVVQAIEKLKQALSLEVDSWRTSLLWQLAQAYTLLGKNGQKPDDLYQAERYFLEAHQQGMNLPSFWMDYGELLMILSRSTGSLSILKKARSFFHKVESSCQDAASVERALLLSASSEAEIFFLTGYEKDFQRADKILSHVVLRVPSASFLWIDWAHLFFFQGFFTQNVSLLESALDKLTSVKASECHPLEVTALIAKTVAALGLLLDKAQLIKEGTQYIEAALAAAAPPHTLNEAHQLLLLEAAGFCDLMWGYYFDDLKYHQRAAEKFKRVIAREGHFWALYGLFQAFTLWGLEEKIPLLLRRAEACVDRLISLKPHLCHLYAAKGKYLLRVFELRIYQKRDLSKLVAAISNYNRACSLHRSELPLPWIYNLGVALDLLGIELYDPEYHKRATQIFSYIYNRDPHFSSVMHKLGSAYLNLGKLTQEKEELDQAITLFDEVLALNAEDERAWFDRGYTFLLLSALNFSPLFSQRVRELRSEAEKSLLKAVELGMAEPLYTLSCLYSLENRSQVALHYLQRAEQRGVLPESQALQREAWLKELRESREFQEFLINRKE